MLSTVLMDLDGTLTDPKEGIEGCIRYALAKLGAPPSSGGLEWCIGPPLRGSFARLLGTDDAAQLERAVDLYRERFAEKGMFENSVYPGIPDALERIRNAGCRLFLATAKAQDFAARIMAHFGLAEFFEGLYGSRRDGRFTEKSDLVAHLVKTEGLDPSRTIMVGDRKHDVIGGRDNGLRTAVVTYGYGSPEEIAAHRPDYVFDSPAAMADFFAAQVASLPRGFAPGLAAARQD